jgi:sulfur carrier protein
MDATIPLTLNGQPHTVPAGTTIASLLATLGMSGPVLVEHNGAALFPRDYPATLLAPGDRLEIIRIVAGG